MNGTQVRKSSATCCPNPKKSLEMIQQGEELLATFLSLFAKFEGGGERLYSVG
jgi:hypothetical protein